MPWPNSWKRVVASSQEISAGRPGAGFTKFSLFETTGVTAPAKRSWLRIWVIQAPDRLPLRAKGSK